MDFVKKNLGLLICAAICLLLAGFLIGKIFSAKKNLQAQEKFISEQKVFFDRAGQERYKLKPERGQELENIAQAQSNFARVEDFYQQGREFLGAGFSFTHTISLPNSSPEALKQISEHIRSMTDFVIKNDLDFPGIAKEYSQIVQKGSINPAEFQPLFRQLHIYRHLLEKIATAGIKKVRSLDWLMGFLVREEDIYTVTPIYLVFTADLETTQKFLNLLSNDSEKLFYLKNVQIIAPDRYSDLVQEIQKDQGPGSAHSPAWGEEGMGEEPMINEHPQGQQRFSTHRPRRIPETDGSGMDSPGGAPSRMVKPEPRRQDFLLYQEKNAEVVVRLDLYEFQKPEPKL